MKIKIFFIALITSINCFSQEISINHNIKDEVVWFIDTVKAEGNSFSNQFNVYVLYIYRNDSSQKGYCCGMSYIDNSYSYSRIKKPNFYFEIGEDVVLVNIDRSVEIIEIMELNLKKINRYKKISIVQKLFPEALGGSTGTYPGMECCFDKNGSIRFYKNNINFIPCLAAPLQPTNE